MKHLLIYTLVAAGIILPAARCTRAPLPGEVAPGGGFLLEYSVEPSRVASRATVPAEEGEDQVNSLYVLFFQETATGAGPFMGYYQAPTVDANGESAPLSSSDQLRVDFKNIQVAAPADPPVTFAPDGAYSLLVAANVEGFLGEGADVDAWLSSMNGKSESAVLNACLLRLQAADDERDDGNTIQRDNLPMSARVKRLAGQAAVAVELRRAVARVDVSSSVPGHTLVSASIWNAYPTTPTWEGVLADYAAPRLQRSYGAKADGQRIVGQLYTFENVAAESAPADRHTTCLILGFSRGDAVRYYRANLNVSAVGQRLQRNTVYRVAVKSLGGEGEPCELDAYTRAAFLLDVAVSEWTLDDRGSVLSDDRNILAVPARDLVFTPAAESRSYAIYTSGPDPLELSRSHLPAGITAALDGRTLTVSVTANEEEREGFIELRVGTLKAVISITQTGNKDMFIDLSRHDLPPFPGNGVFQMEGNVRVNSSGKWSARIHGDGFTFQFRGTTAESPVELLHRAPGETFTITSMGTNPSADDRYAFVSVYLDDDPDAHQVLILVQRGQTTCSFFPPLADDEGLAFDAVGKQEAGRERYEVRLQGDDRGEWTVVAPAGHAARFQVRYYDPSGALVPDATSLSGPGFFDVLPSINNTGQPISVALRLILPDNPAAARTLPLVQGAFSLAVASPPAFPAVGAAAAPVVTLTPALPGARWSAGIADSQRNAAALATSSGDFPATLAVSYPRLPFRHARQGASTTITVTAPAAGVSATVVLRQEPAPWRPLNIRSYDATHDGNLTPPGSSGKFAHFDHFYWAVNNIGDNGNGASDMFSPTGVVPTAAPLAINTGYSEFAAASLPAIPAVPGGLINMNLADRAYNAAIPAIVAWLNRPAPELYNKPANFMILLGDDYPNTEDRRNMIAAVLGVDCYVDHNDSGPRIAADPPPANTPARRLWDYIAVNGPFGSVNTANLSFQCTDSYITSLDNRRPPTTLPLLKDAAGSGRAELAIDPVNRLLFIGNVEMFGTYSNNASEMNDDERRFMKNIIAFAINAAQYGDYFLSDFR